MMSIGLLTYTFKNGQWTPVNAPIPGTEDTNGWNQAEYYETFRSADVNGDGQAELIFRGPYGLFTYAFDRVHIQWYDLNAGDLNNVGIYT